MKIRYAGLNNLRHQKTITSFICHFINSSIGYSLGSVLKSRNINKYLAICSLFLISDLYESDDLHSFIFGQFISTHTVSRFSSKFVLINFEGISSLTLTHFIPKFHCYTPWKPLQYGFSEIHLLLTNFGFESSKL